MNDEQAIRRGQEAKRALEFVGPVLDKMEADAVAALLASEADRVLERQLYAKAVQSVKKTLAGYVRDGETAALLAST